LITLDEVVAHPPTSVHGGRATYGVSLALCRFLDATVTPAAVTLETGAGLSTIVILRRGAARHISVTPYPGEFDAIRTYCASVGIPTASWEPVTASSLDWLPSAALPPLDLVLIDGAHAFPAPFIDWCYTAESLKVGGLMVVDDLQLVTGRILADFMRADAKWDQVHRDQRFAVYRKRVHPVRDERDWLAQAWVADSNPVATVRVVRAGPVRLALSFAARACVQPSLIKRAFRLWLRRPPSA
jgi:predicted O-methyltransferase YrrM